MRGSGSGPVRLQVYLARAGVASRRKSEGMIAAGRVSVNGTVVRQPGTRVSAGDRVEVDGRRVEPEPAAWVALNKPPGYVTTRKDRWGRRTVYSLLPDRMRSLFHVGRLDLESEGILLLTNEGELANRLMHPRYEVTKEYEAWVERCPDRDALRRLIDGVRLKDGPARAREARVIARDDDGCRVRVVLAEGRKREVRRMFEVLGHPVRRLVRTRFATQHLGKMAPGAWRELSRDEVRALRDATRGG